MIIEQLQEKAGFSPIECSVADLFLEEGEGLRNQSARSIAAKLYTAPSTITRLCKRMGYSGYGEFRDLYLDELRYLTGSFTSIDANRPFNKDDESRTIAAKLGALYRETDCVIRASQQTRKAQVPTIALTSYGRSTLADSVDVTLRASTREKLVDKIGCFAMSVSTLFVLDVIYSCILALDYEANLERRITVSRGYEQYRDSSNPILRDRA